jgi:hypothetical protein
MLSAFICEWLRALKVLEVVPARSTSDPLIAPTNVLDPAHIRSLLELDSTSSQLLPVYAAQPQTRQRNIPY